MGDFSGFTGILEIQKISNNNNQTKFEYVFTNTSFFIIYFFTILFILIFIWFMLLIVLVFIKVMLTIKNKKE